MSSEPMSQLPKDPLSFYLDTSHLSLDGILPLEAMDVLSLGLVHPSESIYQYIGRQGGKKGGRKCFLHTERQDVMG